MVVDFDGVANVRGGGGGSGRRGEDVDAGFGSGLEGEEGTDSDCYLDVGGHYFCLDLMLSADVWLDQ